MASVADGLKSQIRNIEATYGRTMSDWAVLIKKSGLAKHPDVVAMLKREHGLAHGAAHRISLIARAAAAPTVALSKTDMVATLLGEKRAHLRPIVDRLLEEARAAGDLEVAPKKGYLSLRGRKQFAMIRPAAKHVDLGLILVGAATSGRLESAAGFNGLFTHRVRVRSIDDIDRDLRGWLRNAHRAAR